MRWIVIWLVGAAVLIFGVGTIYVGQTSFGAGKAGDLYPPPQMFPALLISGVVGLIAGTAGVWRTLARPPASAPPKRRITFANVASPVGLIAAAAALGAVVIVFTAPSIAQQAAGSDPCAQSYSPSCFSAHPDYYQATDGGDHWTTPSSRVNEGVAPFFLVAWPIALAGALISILALAAGTARRRTAIAGLVLGSGIAIGQVLLELGMMLGLGGGD